MKFLGSEALEDSSLNVSNRLLVTMSDGSLVEIN